MTQKKLRSQFVEIQIGGQTSAAPENAITSYIGSFLHFSGSDCPPRYLQYSPPPSPVNDIVGDTDQIGGDDGGVGSGPKPGGGGDGSPGDSGSDSDNGQSSSRSSSDSVISIGPRPFAGLNVLLTPAAYAALPPLMVPRTSWIPGYFTRSRRVRSEIVPWSPTRILYVNVGSLDINTLFHHFSKPKNFIFPPNLHTRTPRSG